MDSIYDRYTSAIRSAVDRQDLTSFKGADEYRYVLEHVSKEYGQRYLDLLLERTPISIDRIRAFCRANDALGSPRLEDYPVIGFAVSPTSLRYLYHAHLLLSHFAQVSKDISIVEIGGGYGGLCAAVGWFAALYSITIHNYSIIDLPDALNLQRLYLRDWTLPFSVTYVSAATYGAELSAATPYCLVSNYCFSEIAPEHQAGYRAALFPKVCHGFLTWNHCPVYDLGFPGQTVEVEDPRTGDQNFYVRF